MSGRSCDVCAPRRPARARCGLCGDVCLVLATHAPEDGVFFCDECQRRCRLEPELPPARDARPCNCGSKRFLRSLVTTTELETQVSVMGNVQQLRERIVPRRFAGVLIEERACLSCGALSRHLLGKPDPHDRRTELLDLDPRGPYR